MMEYIYDRLSIPLLFLNTSYVATLKYCLSTFFCYNFMGTSFMYYLPEEQCFTPKHYNLMMIATTGLIVYVGGLWALLANMLPHLAKTKSFGDKAPLLLFGWLYDMYQAKVSPWGKADAGARGSHGPDSWSSLHRLKPFPPESLPVLLVRASAACPEDAVREHHGLHARL